MFNTKHEAPLNLPREDVFLNGRNKHIVWASTPHHVPVYPNWQELRAVRYNPRLTRRDEASKEVEEDWTVYHRQRYTPEGCFGHSIGTRPSGVPALRLDGYTRNIYGMPPRDIFLYRWPKEDAWTAPARAPRAQYYGYYHEAIEAENFMRQHLQPIHRRLSPFDVPNITSLSCKQTHYDMDSSLAAGLS